MCLHKIYITTQYKTNSATVQRSKKFKKYVQGGMAIYSPKLAQEVHPLLGLLDDGVDVGFPLQVLGDCGTHKPEGFHSQHSTVVYDEGGQCCGGLLLKSTVISIWA